MNYSDTASRGEGMTMVLRAVKGSNASIEAPFYIFQTRQEIIPIQGMPNDDQGVSY